MTPLLRLITAYGQTGAIACDAYCNMAWGISNRPFVAGPDPENEDDIVWLSDIELGGQAPDDPGTEEGGVRKPTTEEDRLNKWCMRECERSVFAGYLDLGKLIELPDWRERRHNISREGRLVQK